VLAHVADQLGVDDAGAALAGGLPARVVALLGGVRGRAQAEQVEHPVADQHVLPQRDRPDLADDDLVWPRTVTSQSPNSSALLTVADSETRVTDCGRWMITSSQTAPRKRSAR
jgi:hypothetical protein